MLYNHSLRSEHSRRSLFGIPEGIPDLIFVSLLIAFLALALLYALVSYLIASGMTRMGEVELEDRPSDYGVKFEDVRFVSRRGDVTLDGWHIAGRDGMPVIIFAHGIGVARSGNGMTELGARLNRMGFGILQFDFRAHGRSEGDRVSSGWHERMDILGAYDYLASSGGTQGGVGVHGISMGAAAACLAAAEESGIRALSLDSPYARARELILQEGSLRTRLPEWFIALFVPCAVFLAERLYDIMPDRMTPEEAVSGLDYPLLVIHGGADTRIPPSHAQRVFDASAEGSRLWIAEGVAHGESFAEDADGYTDRVARYFLSCLGGE